MVESLADGIQLTALLFMQKNGIRLEVCDFISLGII